MPELQNLYYVVNDMPRARRFYEGLLGLEPSFADGERWTQYRGARGNLALASPAEAPTGAQGAVAVLEVANLETYRTLLQAAAIPVLGERDMGSHGRVLSLADPDGNLLQLFARTPRESTNQQESTMSTEPNNRQTFSSGGAFENVFGYSRAVRVGNHLHISGTCAPVGHEHSDACTQARAILQIVQRVLEEAGFTTQDVVRTVVFVRDMFDADGVAKAHLEVFDSVRPASTLVQVDSMLRPWQKVEIETYAIIAA